MVMPSQRPKHFYTQYLHGMFTGSLHLNFMSTVKLWMCKIKLQMSMAGFKQQTSVVGISNNALNATATV